MNNRQPTFIEAGILIGFPLGYLFTNKKKNSVAFIGRDLGNFTDSIKYLFLYVHSLKLQNIDIYFVTHDRETYKKLKNNMVMSPKNSN